jgi:hypothetical protein
MSVTALRPLPKLPPKPYIRTVPQPINKAKAMTVCIASICNNAKNIIAVCDQKISTLGWSADASASKMSIIAKNWWVAWAAEDITQIPAIMENVHDSLWGSFRSAKEVADALSSAYKNHIKLTAERTCLSKFGLTMDSFIAEGATKLTPHTFDKMAEKINQIEAGCQLMAFGFDLKKEPHILILHDPGTIDHYDAKTSSFATIGSGSYRADSTLYFHEINWTTSLPAALYHVCESKFMAESASGVGKSTLAVILQSDGGLIFPGAEVVEKIRSLWEKKGKPCLPAKAEEQINELINHSIDETKQILEEAKRRNATNQTS